MKVSEQEAAKVLADLKRKAAAKKAADNAADKVTAELNRAVKEAMELQGVSRQDMVKITGYSLPRLYQIRDGRR